MHESLLFVQRGEGGEGGGGAYQLQFLCKREIKFRTAAYSKCKNAYTTLSHTSGVAVLHRFGATPCGFGIKI